VSNSSSEQRAALPRRPITDAVLSDDLADFGTPGVVVVLDAGEAEQLGAFEETALTEADAWESNLDLETDEASHGG
jgi:hypothetical protein